MDYAYYKSTLGLILILKVHIRLSTTARHNRPMESPRTQTAIGQTRKESVSHWVHRPHRPFAQRESSMDGDHPFNTSGLAVGFSRVFPFPRRGARSPLKVLGLDLSRFPEPTVRVAAKNHFVPLIEGDLLVLDDDGYGLSEANVGLAIAGKVILQLIG